MKVEYVAFPTRDERARYIAERYRQYLQGKVLDVGCDEARLKPFLQSGTEYLGVDVGGTPDVLLNLEKAERLPFGDAAFDCVICTDVLEHVDNLHLIFGELVRVSRRFVIVSLPNCWSIARQKIHRGRGNFSHYGLPPDTPEDRHKWFFNITEARSFLVSQQVRHPILVRDQHVTEKPRLWPLKALRRIRFPVQSHYLNRYANTLWTLLEKR